MCLGGICRNGSILKVIDNRIHTLSVIVGRLDLVVVSVFST